MEENIIGKIAENVLQGRRNKDDEGIEEDYIGEPGVAELVEEALKSGVPTDKILLDGLRLAKNMKQASISFPIC
ncbi:MAG: hypothetical protein AVO34_13895 [Firmicutes bacterium ML8_F2]|nr:MAG: hypothetical protein AVO34_13895 [Firmicutes bacterium ML8_F2]